ncbi:MAG: 6-bladed beta-propeller [Gemmatimonadota bacterium]
MWSIPGEDVPARFESRRVTALNVPDPGWIAWPDGIAVDAAAGRIYVLDESAPQILAFTFDGAFERTIGRKGMGPGEYEAPTALAVDGDGTLHVMDPGRGGILTWTRAGLPTEVHPLVVPYWGPGLAISSSGPLYTTAGALDDGVMTEALVRVSGDHADTLYTVTSSWKPIDMPCGRVPVPEVFSLSSVWAGRGDLLVFADLPEYALQLHRGAEPVASFRRATGPRRVSEAEAEAFTTEGPLQFLIESCGMTPAGVVRNAGFVSEVSPVLMLSIDPTDRIWAARGIFPAVESIDVFDVEQGYLGSLASPAFPVAFLDESRFVTILGTDLGSSLEIWEIVERSDLDR